MLSILAALVFGAIPVWRGGSMAVSLHDNGRGNTASRGRHRARHVLMGAQVALALVLHESTSCSVASQRCHGIHPSGPAGGKVVGSDGNGGKNHDNTADRQ